MPRIAPVLVTILGFPPDLQCSESCMDAIEQKACRSLSTSFSLPQDHLKRGNSIMIMTINKPKMNQGRDGACPVSASSSELRPSTNEPVYEQPAMTGETPMTRRLLAIVVFALTIAVAPILLKLTVLADSTPSVGTAAPEFTLPS